MPRDSIRRAFVDAWGRQSGNDYQGECATREMARPRAQKLREWAELHCEGLTYPAEKKRKEAP